MKRNILVEIISALLILLFVYTATSKLYDLSSFRQVLKTSPRIGFAGGFLAWAIPLTEIGVSALLYFAATRLNGLYASFILMVLFTAYIGYIALFEPDKPCTCGGVLQSMSWTQHFIFNIFFSLLSIWGIKLLKRDKHKINLINQASLA